MEDLVRVDGRAVRDKESAVVCAERSRSHVQPRTRSITEGTEGRGANSHVRNVVRSCEGKARVRTGEKDICPTVRFNALCTITTKNSRRCTAVERNTGRE